jgi:hypothetical protein
MPLLIFVAADTVFCVPLPSKLTSSSAAIWAVFTEPLPSNGLFRHNTKHFFVRNYLKIKVTSGFKPGTRGGVTDRATGYSVLAQFVPMLSSSHGCGRLLNVMT